MKFPHRRSQYIFKVQMRRVSFISLGHILAICLLATGSVVMSAQQNGALEQSLALAQKQSDIFNRAPRPFLLEADLTIQLAVPTPGRLTIQWQSKNHWRRQLEFGDYKESVVRVGEWEYAQRNVGFAPLRTVDLVELVQFAKSAPHFAPNRARTRKVGGTPLACIELWSIESRSSFELCTDPATHEIASIRPWIYGVDGGNAAFSGYADFEGMRYPTHLELSIGKSIAVSVNITKLEEQPVDANLLKPPAGAIERRYCDVMTPPRMIHQPDLGTITDDVHVRFQVTILKDGTVDSVQVIGQNSAKAADRIRKAYKDVKYKPAMCGTEPVIADIVEGLDITH
jgi:hypothetical protein